MDYSTLLQESLRLLSPWEQEDSLTRSRYERGGMSQKHDSIHACEWEANIQWRCKEQR